MVDIALRDDHMATGGKRDFRGGDFGDHAARADIGGRYAGHLFNPGRDILHFGNERCLRIMARIGAVQAVNIGKQNQHIRPGHLCYARRQPVIIAETDFGGGHRVIFIDDGNGATFQ